MPTSLTDIPLTVMQEQAHACWLVTLRVQYVMVHADTHRQNKRAHLQPDVLRLITVGIIAIEHVHIADLGSAQRSIVIC